MIKINAATNRDYSDTKAQHAPLIYTINLISLGPVGHCIDYIVEIVPIQALAVIRNTVDHLFNSLPLFIVIGKTTRHA